LKLVEGSFFFFDDFIDFARASNIIGSGDGVRLLISFGNIDGGEGEGET
jgi:hypothetical protein